MLIKKLEVAGLRAFDQAEFEFKPGMNLLVGVNGVGKTTVLDALRICLSKLLPEITESRSPKLGFEESDMRVGFDSMQVSCDLEFENKPFNLLIHKQRQEYVENKPGVVREETMTTPDIEKISPTLSSLFPSEKKSKKQPLGIFFSTRRSIVVDRKPQTISTTAVQALAFLEALNNNRDFNLREVAVWMRAQEALGKEYPLSFKHLEALRYAADVFLPSCKNLRIEDTKKPRLLIDKEGKELDIRQLSDGERGVLALALDLARRLSQANPSLNNPIKEGIAIVLIDELDLHLHPKWQRTIIEQLTNTFPNCQFIATTHSPQVIPSVEPEQVLLLKGDEVIHPDKTFGMDTNWILKFIMEAGERPEESAEAIENVEKLIREGNFKDARRAIANYKEVDGFDLPEWSILEARMAKMEILGKGK